MGDSGGESRREEPPMSATTITIHGEEFVEAVLDACGLPFDWDGSEVRR